MSFLQKDLLDTHITEENYIEWEYCLNSIFYVTDMWISHKIDILFRQCSCICCLFNLGFRDIIINNTF